MRPVADTSFLLGLLEPTDRHHEEARDLVDTDGAPIVVIPVLGELMQHLQFMVRRSHGEAAGLAAGRKALDQLEHVVGASIENVRDADGALRVYRDYPRLTFADAVGVSEALARKAPLWTFDREQAKVHGKLVRDS